MKPWPPRVDPGLAALTVLLVALALLPEPWRQSLLYLRDGIAQGQWWRLLSAHAMHLSVPHLLANLASLLLLAVLWRRQRRPVAHFWWSFAGALLTINLSLWLLPEIAWYAGLSGILHGLAAALLLFWALDAPLILLLWLALNLKWIAEAAGLYSSQDLLPYGRVIWEAHAAGCLGGSLSALLLSVVAPDR